jgi:[ribosomal protein S5]-alanine N-acetyltransferase
MVTLTSGRLVLREFVREDFDGVHLYASDPEVVKFMPWGPNTRAETRRFIERNIQAQVVKPRTSYELAITMDGELIGGCGLTIHSLSDKRAEIGYCLRRDMWGKGIATEVAGLLIRFGFSELGMHRIRALCDTMNHGSYRVMEKNAMQCEGVLRHEKNIRGEWRDSYIYSILEHEWRV